MEAIIDSLAPSVLFVLFIVLIITMARVRGVIWENGEPKGKIIIAKVKRCKSVVVYEVLYFNKENNIYYNDVGDEVLYRNIEKFAVLED